MSESSETVSNENLVEELAGEGSVKTRSLWKDAVGRLLRNRLSVIGLIITLFLLIGALFGPYIAPYSYTEQDLLNVAKMPSPDHWLGTDEIGRDLFSRVLWGARTATLVAIFTTFISVIIGVIVGAIAGYGGALADNITGRIIDIVMSVPGLLLAALIAVSIKEPVVSWAENIYDTSGFPLFADTTWLDLLVVFGGLAFVSWPGYARLIRGQIFSLREEQYIEAAKSVGVSELKIALRHLLPNALGPVIVTLTFSFSSAMVLESSLSYLGIGVQPPQASWGNMIASNIGSWSYRPWLVAVPALTLAIVTLGINFLGDGLNDALNPRSKRSI
ncbi:MAG: ABC transporter permease [Caldilineaceae bacterium SB0670_bin_27]|uniref:ABC transporter permease n=1 Tax=Caldilineaceae bacterium SB0664_bin_27 TaxID=2605260 RepID=A0A6B0YQ16_9CHLR|nr:ABC transporter permease [Caldilineaceae bacterium]MDE0337455.1 ABC transporter permease [Caldilineaceae bacterium]MXY93040.1 ABC transporter permease [Caldilineaceae bacterium SB0664_bin_27]MYJ77543.1 ABC transporter permease [Caldilineaceae bacterium SB0670_bin_27]